MPGIGGEFTGASPTSSDWRFSFTAPDIQGVGADLAENRVERLFNTRGVHRKGPLFYLYSFLSIPAGGVLTEVKGFAVFRHLDGADRVVLYTAQLGVSGEIVHNVFR